MVDADATIARGAAEPLWYAWAEWARVISAAVAACSKRSRQLDHGEPQPERKGSSQALEELAPATHSGARCLGLVDAFHHPLLRLVFTTPSLSNAGSRDGQITPFRYDAREPGEIV